MVIYPLNQDIQRNEFAKNFGRVLAVRAYFALENGWLINSNHQERMRRKDFEKR